jgi:hypothetical protein
MKREIRASGFRHTLPAVFWFSALWVVVVVLTPPVVIVVMMLSGLLPPALQGEVWLFLLTPTPIIALVVRAASTRSRAQTSWRFPTDRHVVHGR